jgi:hypothetical protein
VIRALLLKELRESLPLVALVALGIVYVLAELTGWTVVPGFRLTGRSYTSVPFVVQDSFLVLYLTAMVLFAALLGLKQSAWEEYRGVYHYLLFRPLARPTLIAVKLVVGIALVQIAAAILIVWYALWAAAPGHIPAPFLWSMTVDAWRCWLSLPVIFLSAFLSGMRPARWYVTRLVPLVAGVALALVLGLQPWWAIALIGTVLVSAVLVYCILYVAAARDY